MEKSLSRRAFMAGSVSLGASTLFPSKSYSQNVTYADVVMPYKRFLQETYRTPVGQYIISQGTLGNTAQQVFSAVALKIENGDLDNLSSQEQFRILGCHFSDLSGMAQQIADQHHPSGNNPSPRWPFLIKINQDASTAYNDFRSLGYLYDCGEIRGEMFRKYFIK